MFKVLEHMVTQLAIFTICKEWRTLFGIEVKQRIPSNKPTNNASSFDETATASTCTVNFKE